MAQLMACLQNGNLLKRISAMIAARFQKEDRMAAASQSNPVCYQNHVVDILQRARSCRGGLPYATFPPPAPDPTTTYS